MDAKLFAECLRSALSGCSPGPGGCSNEISKVCLDDHEGLKLLLSATEDFAKAAVPDSVFKAFMVARMTALQKPDGSIRGIATGTVFRRLLAKTIAGQFGTAVEAACAPFQFALSARAGADCVGHTVKAATEANPRMILLSVDGIGAFDHVLRAAMLSKLKQVPGLHNLLPFVRKAHSSPSSYAWEDAERQRHSIGQHEGGEQGDPLMPLLFSLAIHDVLEEVQAELEDGELLFAFLDDVYVVCLPHRVRTIFHLLGARLSRVAGIRLHDGKTRVWNKAGECPERVAELGPDVWSPQGVKILGTPVGSRNFVERMATERLAEEQKLWEALAWIPDLQCAWQASAMCRTQMPPLLANSATLPDRNLRSRSRPWHDAGHGVVVGRVHWRK